MTSTSTSRDLDGTLINSQAADWELPKPLTLITMNITGLSSKPKKAFGVTGSPMGFRDRRTKARRIGASDEHFGTRDAEVLASLYPSPLSFYDSVPGCDLSLADFEALAVERLKLLRIMEKHSQVGIPPI